MTDTSAQVNVPTQPSSPNLGSALNGVVEWVAGEISRSPAALKLVGIASTVVAAIPGDFSNSVIRSSLILGGFFLTSVVHMAESVKKN